MLFHVHISHSHCWDLSIHSAQPTSVIQSEAAASVAAAESDGRVTPAPESTKKSSPRKAKASPAKKKKNTVAAVNPLDIADRPEDIITVVTVETVDTIEADAGTDEPETATIAQAPEPIPEQPIVAVEVDEPASPPAAVQLQEHDEPATNVSSADDDQPEISIHISSPVIVELEKEANYDGGDDSSNNTANEEMRDEPNRPPIITLSRSSSSSKHWRLGRARTSSTSSSSASISSPAPSGAPPATAAPEPDVTEAEPTTAEAEAVSDAVTMTTTETLEEVNAPPEEQIAPTESPAVGDDVSERETANSTPTGEQQPQRSSEQNESNDSNSIPDKEVPEIEPSNTDEPTDQIAAEPTAAAAADENVTAAAEASPEPTGEASAAEPSRPATPEQSANAEAAESDAVGAPVAVAVVAAKPYKPVQRKRKWISAKTIAAAAGVKLPPIVAITTETLKELISDVRPVSLADVQLDSSPEPEERPAPSAPKAAGKTADDDAAQRDETGETVAATVPAAANNGETSSESHAPAAAAAHESVKVSAAPSVGGRKVMLINADASVVKARPPSPAKFGSSQILYITNLVRPFTVQQLKTLLARTGKLCEDGFWIDKIKSKCYVKYETEE